MKHVVKNILMAVITVGAVIPVVIAANRHFTAAVADKTATVTPAASFELSEADYENASLIDHLVKQLHLVDEGKMMSATLQYTDTSQESRSFKKKMILWKKEHLFFQQLGNIIVMNHPDAFFQIDHDRQMIIITPPVNQLPEQVLLYNTALETLKGEYYKTRNSINGSLCGISLSNPNHISVTGIDFLYSCTDSLLRSVQLHQRKEIRIDRFAPVVSVAYTDIAFSDFDYDHYMRYEQYAKRSGKEWVITEPYQHYDLTVLN